MITDLILLLGKVKEAAINATLAAIFLGLPLGICALVDILVPEQTKENTLPPTCGNHE